MALPASTTCPACGAVASGSFCSGCGASLAARRCGVCGAAVVAGARFCHRCGRSLSAAAPARRSERGAWIVAAVVVVLAVTAIIAKVRRDAPAPALPDMANPGAAAGMPAGPAPDISRMSPRERFDRLFNRVVAAAERGDTAEVLRFTPMALGAYAQLDTADADARYHAAVLLLETGQDDAAAALADTMLAAEPNHLFGWMIRGRVAARRGDSAAARRAAGEFLQRYDAELRARRREYEEHRAAVEQFRSTAASGEP
ncbi:MAG TPA: zinc ribbon domain-containing protein [Gemmatimonadales bacterium]|nr:zinc ribbon domain-containing protein [Gemmatimonadales bacterium]